MGGAWESVLFIETPPGIHCYVFFTYGYHIADFLRHVRIPIDDRDNDWREMFLHHIAAVALYPGFIFSNIMGLGVVLAWLHDIADITVCICRISNILDLRLLTPITWFVMLITWGYTRIFILPLYIYATATEVKFPAPVEHFTIAIQLELCFLSIMQVLHIFWFYLFLLMGWRLVMKGEQKELINTIESEVDETKKAQ
jgi:hypothetical protein